MNGYEDIRIFLFSGWEKTDQLPVNSPRRQDSGLGVT